MTTIPNSTDIARASVLHCGGALRGWVRPEVPASRTSLPRRIAEGVSQPDVLAPVAFNRRGNRR